jgi:single-strand DNA-binding protein
MLNQCNFIGRTGKDPVIRHTPSGDAVASFSIALDESYKKDGVKVEKVEWINVVAFKSLAVIIEKYVTKGQLLFISGKIQTRKYADKDGQEKYVTEIVAHEMKMLGSKEKSAQSTEPATNGSFEDLKEDLPF